jgi:hypothetical protein
MTDHWNRKSFRDGVQVAWDGTSVELAQTCPRKYYYRMIENITPAGTSVHLLFGGIYASALELFYHRRALGDDLETALIAAVREAMILSWDHERDDEGQRKPGTGQPHSFQHSAKTVPNLIRTIVWYVEQFGDESESAIKTHHLQNGKPAVELSFTLEMSEDIVYCGHLDRVVDFGGGLYWMDQKTTGSTISPSFFDGFKPSNQFLGYTWAGQVVLQSPDQGRHHRRSTNRRRLLPLRALTHHLHLRPDRGVARQHPLHHPLHAEPHPRRPLAHEPLRLR